MNSAIQHFSGNKTSLTTIKDEKKAPRWVFSFLQFSLLIVCKLLWRVKFSGLENIPTEENTGLIIAANHPTYLDPILLTLKVKRDIRYLAWDKACNWFILGKIIRWLGAFPINPKRGGKNALLKSLHFLRQGKTLIIFPEGSREFADGKPLEFKPGTIRIALETGVPILPATIRGANKVWSREQKYPRLGKIEIEYHPLFYLPKIDEKADIKKQAELITQQLEKIITKNQVEILND